jgi:heme exporter protein D
MSNALWIAGGLLLVALVAGYIWLQSVKRRLAKAREEDQRRRQDRLENLPSIPLSERGDDAIYQWSFHHGDRLVARTVKAEVDESAKRVSFMEITHSDLLLLPDECHFRKYKLEIDTIGDATKVDKMDPDKGRILRNVTAHITGYVEQ